MTGAEAWSIVAPMIYIPTYSRDSPQCEAMMDAYVTMCIGSHLYDNWVANGKPKEWQEKPERKKK